MSWYSNFFFGQPGIDLLKLIDLIGSPVPKSGLRVVSCHRGIRKTSPLTNPGELDVTCPENDVGKQRFTSWWCQPI